MAASDGHLRVSDAERDQVIEALRQHTADGRLTMAEFEERVGEALAATSRADLAPVLRELPPLQRPAAAPRTPRPQIAWPSARTVTLAAVVVVATLMVLQGAWWIVFPLMFAFGGCGRARSCATRWTEDGRVREPDTVADDELIRV